MCKDELTDCETNARLDGKVALVTGSISGLGLQVAKNLAKRGAKVIITGHNILKLENARNNIIISSGNPYVVARHVDYASLDSVRSLAYTTLNTEPKLDILINNVGVMGLEDTLTADHLHLSMQVNYFSTFLLTFLLFPLLRFSAPSRIINVSALPLLLGDIDLDHWNHVGRYSNFGYYSNAKLAEVLFSAEMARRVKDSKVSVFSMDPGVLKTDLYEAHNNIFKLALNAWTLKFGRKTRSAALMPVFLAADPSVEGKSGKHFRDCREFFASWLVNNTKLTKRMWRDSKRLVRINMFEDWEHPLIDIK